MANKKMEGGRIPPPPVAIRVKHDYIGRHLENPYAGNLWKFNNKNF